ncbi:hypothetical protein [Pseudoxanthomonas sp. 10H]|uniref:hypothetical protein n=1 Tax=Pseudoxanthomonas sp. 10H TaxID=3242729 RepID=UPI0035573652
MRACKAFLATLGLVLAIGAVQASSRQDTLRISLTIVDRCDVRDVRQVPAVDCSAGVPWMVAQPLAPHLQVTGNSLLSHLPVPAGRPADGVQVTTIVF